MDAEKRRQTRRAAAAKRSRRRCSLPKVAAPLNITRNARKLQAGASLLDNPSFAILASSNMICGDRRSGLRPGDLIHSTSDTRLPQDYGLQAESQSLCASAIHVSVQYSSHVRSKLFAPGQCRGGPQRLFGHLLGPRTGHKCTRMRANSAGAIQFQTRRNRYG